MAEKKKGTKKQKHLKIFCINVWLRLGENTITVRNVPENLK